MPCSYKKARQLLKTNKAVIVNYNPFTIKLIYGSSGYKQSIILGIDSGSKYIGISATTVKTELYASESQLRTDIVDLLATRRQNRRTRRSRLRYRKPRFLNRVKSKKKGWLAPSIRHKIENHLKLINKIHLILPIQNIIIETASFDIQKINNPSIYGVNYQIGNLIDIWNVREYVLYRDGHTCQHCKGASKDNILNVHHIESRKTGGDAPNNLITVCETCHNKHHKGKISFSFKRDKSFRDASVMSIMRWFVYNKLKEKYINVSLTYGYITKNTRIINKIEKTHVSDAFCIANNLKAKRLDFYYKELFKRKNNRQIHKSNKLKGGKLKLNQSPYVVKGFRLFDKIKYKNQIGYITGRRNTGYFVIKDINYKKIHDSVKVKDLKLIEVRNTIIRDKIILRRLMAIPPTAKPVGFLAKLI